MLIAQSILWVALVYTAVGALFALAFAWRGAGRLNPSAVAGSGGFRLLILPASAALWPYLALRWLASVRSTPPGIRGHA